MGTAANMLGYVFLGLVFCCGYQWLREIWE
jgi:hypothetical protein